MSGLQRYRRFRACIQGHGIRGLVLGQAFGRTHPRYRRDRRVLVHFSYLLWYHLIFLFGIVRTFVLRAPNAYRRVFIFFPILVFFTLWVNLFYVLNKGVTKCGPPPTLDFLCIHPEIYNRFL